jgi:hypothetical protein
MTRACLLITDRFEPTADLLVSEMRRRGTRCVRWNLDQYPLGSTLTYRLSAAQDEAEIVSDGRRITLAEVGSIWCRAYAPMGFAAELNAADRKFAATEAERALAGLLSRPDIVWINHPHRHIVANSKPEQLAAARRVGLAIPPTLVSNDPDEVRAFMAAAPGPVVYKCFSQALDLPEGQAQFTGVVTPAQQARLDLIRTTPGVFQHYVPKRYELRITVVGERVFAGRINSQATAESSVDWRHRPFDMESEPYALPERICKPILAFMRDFGLIYGAFDFIVTPDGDYVFLEVNPGGQYMWVESTTGMPITEALADAMCEPRRLT